MENSVWNMATADQIAEGMTLRLRETSKRIDEKRRILKIFRGILGIVL